jgi:trans-2,3-dihydro-3-hydroxyanthranilate isomerase
LSFYILDVFAEKKYTGNQLAVFRDAEALSSIQMQKIAKEMHYSETTFILSDVERNGGYDVRIFTPEKEVPFAGHPTLGTAYVIKHEIVEAPVDTIVLNLKVGQIPVTLKDRGREAGILWMKQKRPSFGKTFDVESISSVLNIDADGIETRFPIEEVSTGFSFIMVPLKKLEAMKKIHIIRDKYFELIRNIPSKGILVFCPDTYSQKNDLNVRVFVDYYGIPEDPATGSGNGSLAGYLVKHRYFGKDHINVRVEQGYEIGRPSLLFLKAEGKEGEIEVQVGGKVEMIAKGKFV